MHFNVLCGEHFEEEKERGELDAWAEWTPIAEQEFEEFAVCMCRDCPDDTFEGHASAEEWNQAHGICDCDGCSGREGLTEVYRFEDGELEGLMTEPDEVKTYRLDELENQA